MPDLRKISSFDPTKVHPKVLIVSCTADISYVDHLKDQYFKGIDRPARAIDFMEFLHPGGFPVDDSLDAIVEVMARFAIPEIALVSHIDCGLVDSLAKFTQVDQANPYLFAGYSSAVTEMLHNLDVDKATIGSLNVGEVTALLSKLVTNRVAQHLLLRSTEALKELEEGETTDEINCRRLSDLRNCSIAAYSYLGEAKGLVTTIERFHPDQIDDSITF